MVELVRALLNGVTELRFCSFLGEECVTGCSSLVLLSRSLSTDSLFSSETTQSLSRDVSVHGGSVEWLRLSLRDLDCEEGGRRGGRGCRLGMAAKKRERFIEERAISWIMA